MRIRTIKPEFFLHEGLFELERETTLPVRLAFTGLWCIADREGRFKWEPRKIGVQVMPYDLIDFSRVLHALTTRGFVVKYSVDSVDYGYIPSFCRHQVINNRERDSDLPEPTESNICDASTTRGARVTTRNQSCKAEGKGMEGNKEQGKEGKGREGEVPPLADALFHLWSEFDFLPQIQSVTTKRKAALSSRMKDPYFRDHWQEAISKIGESEFLKGNNDRGWRADIDWFLRPDSVTKIMEGKYGNGKQSTLEKQTFFDESYETIQ
jgi:hypothetical protein